MNRRGKFVVERALRRTFMERGDRPPRQFIESAQGDGVPTRPPHPVAALYERRLSSIPLRRREGVKELMSRLIDGL